MFSDMATQVAPNHKNIFKNASFRNLYIWQKLCMKINGKAHENIVKKKKERIISSNMGLRKDK